MAISKIRGLAGARLLGYACRVFDTGKTSGIRAERHHRAKPVMTGKLLLNFLLSET